LAVMQVLRFEYLSLDPRVSDLLCMNNSVYASLNWSCFLRQVCGFDDL
jgi:hypothetical protein